MAPRFQITCLGFATVDIIVENGVRGDQKYLGGSAANVAAILSFYGMESKFSGTVGNDSLGHFIVDQFDSFGVDTNLLVKLEDYRTPFCFENIISKDGKYVTHSFATSSPDKIENSSRYCCILEYSREHLAFARDSRVIYVNRQDPILREIIGSDHFVFYDPEYIDDYSLHSWLCARADVLKYSHQQFIDFSHDVGEEARSLVIETFGHQGLSFRNGKSAWHYVSPCQNIDQVDPTGAGDWFSAALIRQITTAQTFQPHDWSIDQCVSYLKRAGQCAAESTRYKTALGKILYDGCDECAVLEVGEGKSGL